MTPPVALAREDETALTQVARALAAARASGDCAPLIASLSALHALRPRLPSAFGPVLEGIEQRLQSSAMFGEESCSFSVHYLFDSLDTWLERARMRLSGTPRAATL
ncbi:MAG TPA: hypothetical protein PK359_10295 [Burkholderiaceae bacterium]|nr:hypothetical protein [Burkholderiaceae bacterium]